MEKSSRSETLHGATWLEEAQLAVRTGSESYMHVRYLPTFDMCGISEDRGPAFVTATWDRTESKSHYEITIAIGFCSFP
jgi:hypothetical protein